MTYDNIKSHKKPGLHSLSIRYILGKTTGGKGHFKGGGQLLFKDFSFNTKCLLTWCD